MSTIAGCNAIVPFGETYQPTTISKEQIRLHAVTPNPAEGRLLDELVAIRPTLLQAIGLQETNKLQPIDVYLFGDEESFREFTSASNAVFADRRAFFIKTTDALNVYGFWGMHVAEDLRHEVTHGYLHSMVPEIELWIDEGLAEYFEVGVRQMGTKQIGAEQMGRNEPHIQRLAELYDQGRWQPDLARLEAITDPTKLNQSDYAEAWLWTHWLLSNEQGRQLVRSRFQPATEKNATTWAQAVQQQFGDATEVTQHLLRLKNSKTRGR